MNKIAIDLRALQIGHENRGIGVVAKKTLEGLSDANTRYIFYIFDDTNPLNTINLSIPKESYKIVRTKRLNTEVKKPYDIVDALKLSFHKFTKLRAEKPDTFIQFDFNLGLIRSRRIKTIIIGYDLIPLILDKQYLPKPFFALSHTVGRKAKAKAFLRAIYYRSKAKRNYQNFRRANKVLAISDTVRTSFIDILGIRPEKIDTLFLGADVSNKYSDAILKKLNISKDYIFYIGGTDARKSVSDLIYAFNITKGRGSDIELVLAGNEFVSINKIPDPAAVRAIKNSPYKDSIKLAGYITNEEKNSLYKNAHAFVFCSTYEGFGLPAIEAQKNQCPVIAYDNSCLHELLG